METTSICWLAVFVLLIVIELAPYRFCVFPRIARLLFFLRADQRQYPYYTPGSGACKACLLYTSSHAKGLGEKLCHRARLLLYFLGTAHSLFYPLLF